MSSMHERGRQANAVNLAAGLPAARIFTAAQRSGPPYSARYLLPQQLSRPNFVSLLSTPDIGLSVISVTPVSW